LEQKVILEATEGGRELVSIIRKKKKKAIASLEIVQMVFGVREIGLSFG